MIFMVLILRVPPRIIDVSNINKLYEDCVLRIVKSVLKLVGDNLGAIYIDGTSSLHRLHKYLEELLNPIGLKPKLIIEYGADRKYPVVSAASIIAKYLRDRHIEDLHRIYGDFGSGYPSDPKTLNWLRRFKDINDLPPIVRRSWSTIKKLGISSVNLERWFNR